MLTGPLILAVGAAITIVEMRHAPRTFRTLEKFRYVAKISITSQGRFAGAGLGFVIVGTAMTLNEIYEILRHIVEHS